MEVWSTKKLFVIIKKYIYIYGSKHETMSLILSFFIIILTFLMQIISDVCSLLCCRRIAKLEIGALHLSLISMLHKMQHPQSRKYLEQDHSSEKHNNLIKSCQRFCLHFYLISLRCFNVRQVVMQCVIPWRR